MKKIGVIVLLMTIVIGLSAHPKPIPLWRFMAGKRCQPTKLYAYPAPDSLNTGIAVIVCPGGSYSHTMGIKTEGFAVAEWLNTQGINAFVLKYRTSGLGYHHPAMLQDAQLALQFVRANASLYGVNVNRVGAMGFSAGGHLVTMLGAFHADSVLLREGVTYNYSNCPDFVVPVYPVVSMSDEITHKRSRRNLCPHWRRLSVKTHFSMEQNIPADMPPTFLVTAKDDPKVNPRNSVCLDSALAAQHIAHRFLLYETGGHGYAMNESRAPEAARWKYLFTKWIRELYE